MLSKTTFKMRNQSEAISWCAHGLSLSKNLNDEIMAKMFEFINALYVDDDKEKLNSILNYLESKSMLSDVEDLASDAAKYYNEKEDHKVANVFYEKVLYARKQIQRGDCLYAT